MVMLTLFTVAFNRNDDNDIFMLLFSTIFTEIYMMVLLMAFSLVFTFYVFSSAVCAAADIWHF